MPQARNRNALRTERLIQDAFVTIVERDGRDALNVAALCREADINRSTFYAHYDNLDELRLRIASDLMDMIIRGIMRVLRVATAEEARTVVRYLADVYANNRTLYLAVAHANPDVNGMTLRDNLFEDEAAPDLARTLTADFLLSSITATFHTWAVGAYGDVSAEEVGEQVAHLVIGARGLT